MYLIDVELKKKMGYLDVVMEVLVVVIRNYYYNLFQVYCLLVIYYYFFFLFRLLEFEEGSKEDQVGWVQVFNDLVKFFYLIFVEIQFFN